MKNNILQDISSSFIFPAGLLLLILLLTQCQSINENFDHKANATRVNQQAHITNEKQKGAHIFGRLDSNNLQPFVQNNIEWITLVPYSSQKDFDTPNVVYIWGDSLRAIRRDSMWSSQIAVAHAAGFKVFLKPHVWLDEPRDGKWRSDIFPANEEDWKLWQKDYRAFILHYAEMAQKNEVELFCIGAELARLTVEKSDFWKTLIKEIRSIYSGKITYAANWHNEYEKISFWDDLDYIGIQAYFPLVKNKNPSVKQISKGWNKYLSTIESIHKKYNRKVLFTEMGYKSTADSAIEPWLWVENSNKGEKTISYETQANCYQAFFNTVWKKEWFAGVHIWQLRSDYTGRDGRGSLDFTPQGKPAETVITNGFE